jgi:sRNA-binding carbon storage regulator CsrA
MPVSEVNVYDGNSTVGVRVMRMNENAVIVNFAATKSEDKEEEEIKAAIEESEKESASALDSSMASSVVDEDEI